MKGAFMGRITARVTIENLEDVWALRKGKINSEQVRRIEVSDALVDTGAVAFSLPTRLIKELGLVAIGVKNTITASGPAKTTQYDAVRITIQDRSCTVDVLEVPDQVPVLVGQIPLEFMDFIVDPVNRRLVGNPEHGGQQVLEVL
jgi:predicted aspartyl protease